MVFKIMPCARLVKLNVARMTRSTNEFRKCDLDERTKGQFQQQIFVKKLFQKDQQLFINSRGNNRV